MAVTSTGDIAGSVTGGCVEGAVFDEAQEVIQTGSPNAWAMVFLIQLPGALGWLAAGQSGLCRIAGGCVLADTGGDDPELLEMATGSPGHGRCRPGVGKQALVWPDGRSGDLGSAVLNAQAAASARCWVTHSPVLVTGTDELSEVEYFIDVLPPPPRLVIIGAVHIAIPLITIAKAMNFQTIVIDPRSAFATRERFPHADELIVDWPSSALEELRPDAVPCCCLSHDDKLDNPALQVALASSARYVGALGSRKTHASRLVACAR